MSFNIADRTPTPECDGRVPSSCGREDGDVFQFFLSSAEGLKGGGNTTVPTLPTSRHRFNHCDEGFREENNLSSGRSAFIVQYNFGVRVLRRRVLYCIVKKKKETRIIVITPAGRGGRHDKEGGRAGTEVVPINTVEP